MKLIVFATYGSSLKTWRDAGILDRELAIYQDHIAEGIEVTLVTYGNADDLEIIKPYKKIKILCNHLNLHPRLYAWVLPFLHKDQLASGDLYKTNQMYGAHIATRCSKKFNKPLIVRQGYGHYEHRLAEYGEDDKRTKEAFVYEGRYLKYATRGVFTSHDLAKRAIERHALSPTKIHVIPNYVINEDWDPAFVVDDAQNPPFRLTFFGRFTEQKNLENLILACEGLPVHLTLVGEGPLQASLSILAKDKAVSIDFPGRLHQSQIRDILLESTLFVLVSHYEGNPKALLEAMMLGIPVLASDAPGLANVAKHNETAFLSKTDANSIKTAIMALCDDPLLRIKLGKQARDFAQQNFGLKSIAHQERDIFKQALHE